MQRFTHHPRDGEPRPIEGELTKATLGAKTILGTDPGTWPAMTVRLKSVEGEVPQVGDTLEVDLKLRLNARVATVHKGGLELFLQVRPEQLRKLPHQSYPLYALPNPLL